MRKYRASLLLFGVAIIFAFLHFFFGWQDYVIEAAEEGNKAHVSDFLYRFAKEETEAFPAEVITLAVELALFAGIFQMFKPYDPDTEKIKKLEESIHSRLDRMEERRKRGLLWRILH